MGYARQGPAEHLIRDQVCDTDPLDRHQRKQRVEMIAPRRSNCHKLKTQDRRSLRGYGGTLLA